MRFYAIALIALIYSTAGYAQANSNSSAGDDPSQECLKQKTLEYFNRPELAVDLANLIALECAELLPQSSSEDCGPRQRLCDEVQVSTNRQITSTMREYAYKIIVALRQSGM